MSTTSPVTSVMPLAWCGATTIIIASGLVVPMSGGPAEAGIGYVFEAVGYGQAFMRALALYSGAAALLGVAFMFAPRITGWQFNKGLAWSTFLLMAIGGALMLIVPPALPAIAAGGGESATALARSWSGVWLEAGERITVAGCLVAAATFLDAYLQRLKA